MRSSNSWRKDVAKRLTKREKLLGIFEMGHRALRGMKDEDLAPPPSQEEVEEVEKEATPTEEGPGFLERLGKWLDED
jgi:hypothetical protein